MILGFHEKFEEMIHDGTKIHTIRRDEGGRWTKPGMMIDMVTGHRTKEQYCFARKVFTGTEKITIYRRGDGSVGIVVNGDGLMFVEAQELMRNDGLTPEAFADWFLKDADVYEGFIIHWTDKRYRTPEQLKQSHQLKKITDKFRRGMQRTVNKYGVSVTISDSNGNRVEFNPEKKK